MKMFYSGVLLLLMSVCPNVFAQNPIDAINSELLQLQESNELTKGEAQWVVTSQHTSSISGINHVYFSQTYNGIEINGTQSSIHVMADGNLLKSNIQFVGNIAEKTRGVSAPSITALQAVQNAANQLGYGNAGNISVLSQRSTANQLTSISKGAISLSTIPAKLVYQITEEGDLVLSWDLSIEEVAQENWWSVRVDATSGQIIHKDNWMISCSIDHDHSEHNHTDHANHDHDDHGNDVITLDFNKNLYDIPNYDEVVACAEEFMGAGGSATYEVFEMPIESPFFGPRTNVSGAELAAASPFGWHDTDGAAGAEFTVTRGNNVNAYEDGDNPGFQPDGGATLDFTGYPFSQTYSNANQFESAAITNLFYWNNIIHDLLHVYGFDAASGNFQENNYGAGGSGSDSVNAEAQDGSGTCNANFGTPPDGQNPRMQMYICGDKDGDYDNLVVVHEYGHGISIRLTGGAANSGCLGTTEQMGEGWSDWYGAIMTIEPGDTGADPRPVGTYLFGQGPNGPGIRPQPYSTDFSINNQTYSDISSVSIPHGVGSVWASMIWEMTWELINEYGWDPDIYNFTGDVTQDKGNVMAMALVTEGLKLQPCGPGFVDGRDAILAADAAIYGGANQCFIWDAFARRGLGVSASQGSPNSVNDGNEAFDTPSQTATIDAGPEVCAGTAPIPDRSGGFPLGGVYSGPGVTDNGDGQTFTFDPVAAGVGIHTINYDVPASSCAAATSASDTIEVLAVPPGPSTTGANDFCVGDDVTVSATLSDPTNVIRWYDAAVGGNLLSVGEDYTFAPPGGTTSVFAQEAPDVPLSQLVFSEFTLETPDQLEIQNVGEAADYTDYAVAISDIQPGFGINTVNPDIQILGPMGSDSVLSWNDNGGPQFWGSNIWWGEDIAGWAIIIDDQGNVVDSVFWNLSTAEIATFNVTINGFSVTAADLDWTGPGAAFNIVCNDSFRRDGDSNSAANWPTVCLASDYGVANDDINVGITGCLGERTETLVVSDALAPTVTCPADQTVTINSNETFTVPDYSPDVVATDNCAVDTITQDLAIGSEIGGGTYTITITVTDTSGNEATCSFVLEVEEILGVETLDSNAIGLYPNPTTGIVQLVNNANLTIENITIFDVNGRIINQLDQQSQFDTVSLENVANGMYFINIQTTEGSLMKKVVKK